jgi:hypothetical protein
LVIPFENRAGSTQKEPVDDGRKSGIPTRSMNFEIDKNACKI